jgi:hypothetical protein
MHIQASILWVGFEATIPAFERAKTVHASDRSATEIGQNVNTETKIWSWIPDEALILRRTTGLRVSQRDVDCDFLFLSNKATWASSIIKSGRKIFFGLAVSLPFLAPQYNVLLETRIFSSFPSDLHCIPCLSKCLTLPCPDYSLITSFCNKTLYSYLETVFMHWASVLVLSEFPHGKQSWRISACSVVRSSLPCHYFSQSEPA